MLQESNVAPVEGCTMQRVLQLTEPGKIARGDLDWTAGADHQIQSLVENSLPGKGGAGAEAT